MTKTINTAAARQYVAPVCELVENLLEGMLCDSQDGTTEDFGDLGDFSW